MITVEYAPGGSDPIHRHNAHALVYVLEGSIVQMKGGQQVTLTPEPDGKRHRYPERPVIR
jgi:quercetin dioxygenase-like cupin family protein